jgi:hypothetical protein
MHSQNTVLSKTETENFAFYQLFDELVAARKFSVKPPLNARDFVEFRFVRPTSNISFTAAFRCAKSRTTI